GILNTDTCSMQARKPSVTLIVAATLANGIGAAGRLPWRLSKEMGYFAKVTSSVPEQEGTPTPRNSVIMGRKTWDSIPSKFRPLKDRVNVVVIENNVVKINSIEEACAFPSSDPSFQPQIYRRFLIGGAQLYQYALTRASDQYILDRILLTRILDPAFEECDTFLPEFHKQPGSDEVKEVWRQADHETLSQWVGFDVPEGVQEEKGVKYVFQMWVRDENNTQD
ncbi:14750_t:CDS:2, partial [Acaulospora colombiana]